MMQQRFRRQTIPIPRISPFPARYAVFALCLAGFVASLAAIVLLPFHWFAWVALVVCAALAGLGVRDLRQTPHAILRNYPVSGHLRFMLEYIRPEIRQYFIESDREAAPFSRAQRSLVYQRGKGEPDKRPFGTQIDVSQSGYEWINHSLQPTRLADHDFRIVIGATPNPATPPRCCAPALRRQRLQHLGDELRRAVGQRHPGAQPGRQDGQLRARHRRRLDLGAPPRARRRPDLGNRLRLLRLPQRRRLLQRGALHRQRARPAGAG